MKAQKFKTLEDMSLEFQKNPQMTLSQYYSIKTGWHNLLGSVSENLKILLPIIKEYEQLKSTDINIIIELRFNKYKNSLQELKKELFKQLDKLTS